MLLKFAFGVVLSMIAGVLPPEFIAWLAGWRNTGPDSDRGASVRYGKRRRFRRRAT
jgi:hypothetical protein